MKSCEPRPKIACHSNAENDSPIGGIPLKMNRQQSKKSDRPVKVDNVSGHSNLIKNVDNTQVHVMTTAATKLNFPASRNSVNPARCGEPLDSKKNIKKGVIDIAKINNKVRSERRLGKTENLTLHILKKRAFIRSNFPIPKVRKPTSRDADKTTAGTTAAERESIMDRAAS